MKIKPHYFENVVPDHSENIIETCLQYSGVACEVGKGLKFIVYLPIHGNEFPSIIG